MRGFLFLALAFGFFLVWVLAFVVFHVTAALLHVLLVLGVIALIIHFVWGRSSSGV